MWNIVKEKDKPSKTKLLIAGHDFKFAVELIKYFEELNSFEIKIDKWNGHNSHNLRKSKKLLDWADIIFCEWCLGNAVWYSKNNNKNKKLILKDGKKTQFSKTGKFGVGVKFAVYVPACLASSPGRISLTAVWISREVTVGFLL